MEELRVKRTISRYYETGQCERVPDEIIKEHRIDLRLDGEPFLQIVLSPSLVREYTYGFLRTRGLIEGTEDISSLEIGNNSVSVSRNPGVHPHKPELTILETTGTKNLDLTGAYALRRKIAPSDLKVRAKVILEGIEKLSYMPLYKRSGGTHCAILFSSDGGTIAVAEDIGRHNAVDKAIGGGMLKGTHFLRSWLAVSGRLPADMVMKAVVVGIPLIASVSAATSDGIDAGERFRRHRGGLRKKREAQLLLSPGKNQSGVSNYRPRKASYSF